MAEQRQDAEERVAQLERVLDGIMMATVIYLPDGTLLPATTVHGPATVAGVQATRAALMNMLAQLDGALVQAARQEQAAK